MKKLNDGYIFVLTLIVMGLLSAIAVQVYYLSFNYSAYSAFAIKREKAKMLALSGVQLARDSLYCPPQKEEKKGEGGAQASESSDKKEGAQQKSPLVQVNKKEEEALAVFFEKVLPLINHWRTVKISDEKVGIAGEIKTYVACEDGKIHLNYLLDLMTKKGLSEERVNMLRELWKNISQLIKSKKDLYDSALDFFDRRNRIWLNDTSEILDASGFQVFSSNLFVDLSNRNKDAVYLMDFFTPVSRYAKLDPWVLSASVQKLLGLKSDKIDKGVIAEITKDFKSAHTWQNDWDKLLKPIYGKEFNALPKGFDLMLSVRFDPVAFSVVSYGIVDDIKQGVYTILAKKQHDDGSAVFLPMKTYWTN